VFIVADSSLDTLLDCQYQQLYKAERGQHGMGKNRTGRAAQDVFIHVPVGTLVWDAATGEALADLDSSGSRFLVARGGRGGRGNARFATPRNRAPRRFEEGAPGEEKTVILELKLLADVGLVGLPNSGKSTLLARMTNARPIIADYPFSTKHPVLGVHGEENGTKFVMADIPGLIENAHQGAGMGDQFLRHVERTRLLVHVIDADPSLIPDAETRFSIIMNELESFNPKMSLKPMIVALNKIDVQENRAAAHIVRKAFEKRGFRVHEISALSGEGLSQLIGEIITLLDVRA
jgi:GTP-binding protein